MNRLFYLKYIPPLFFKIERLLKENSPEMNINYLYYFFTKGF